MLITFLLQCLSLLASFASARGSSVRTIRELRQRLLRRDVDPATLYPAYNLSVPIDHFHNDSKYEPHSSESFNLRYWFDASHYKAGGPVIVLQSGESSGVDRLPYLQKGLLAELAQATNGIGVVLEHRYYGTSFPTPDLSIENLRFLTTDQALADQAYFSQHITFQGLEDVTLTAPTAPHIAYGGSYAGAFVAFLRKLYPDVYWGAIGSSAVTEVLYDYWEYYEPVRKYGPPACIAATQQFVHVVDSVLLGNSSASTVQELKDLFGLGGLSHNTDFANQLGSGVGGWQSLNWDPAVNVPSFTEYCGNITSPTVLYPATSNRSATAQAFITASGYQNASELVTPMLNYIGWINATVVATCAETLDECYGTYNASFYAQDDLDQWSWRSWPYQYCTQWGFLQVGSSVPDDIMPVISRTIDIPYTSIICRDAFNITTPSDVDAITKYGGYNISYPRLAFIDGEIDPWRPVTPHSDDAPARVSTASEPFVLIEGGVHHWDENGLFPNETTATLPPQPVADTQKLEIQFVTEWMLEWELHELRLLLSM